MFTMAGGNHVARSKANSFKRQPRPTNEVNLQKQDAAHEPECSHVEHFGETSYLNNLVHFSPVTVPAHCRLWNAEEAGVQSVARGV